MKSTLLVFLLLEAAARSQTIVNFDPSNPNIGPFPTDYLTVADATQKTGLRINLPLPDCGSQPTACQLARAFNELDGFQLQPRIRINFSAPIDPTTLKSGVFFVWLDNLTTEETGLAATGHITTINQIGYDPDTNTAYAKPDEFFDQHRQYALIVTDAILMPGGTPVAADPNFTACLQSPTNDYCTKLQTVASAVSGAVPGNIVALSTFTTMTATGWLEQARDLLPQVPLNFQSLGDPVKAAGLTKISVLQGAGGRGAFAIPISPALNITLDGID